jgi:uncharacterized protein (TIGR02646 family)
MSHRKCAYCEHRFGRGSRVEIEHYISRYEDPNLVFEWTNLLPACQLCNGAKLHQIHGGLLVRPDEEDPEAFFSMESDTGKLIPNPLSDDRHQERASATIKLCDLNRGDLREIRLEEMQFVVRLITRLSREEPESIDDMKALLKPSRAYKFVLRHTLELHGQHVLAEEDRTRFQA